MKVFRKLISILLIVIMVFGLLPGLLQRASAMGTVNVTYDTFINGTINIKWDLLPVRGATFITYHTPKTDNTANTLTLPVILSSNANPNKAAVPGLKNDYIYDIKVDVYDTDNVDGSGHPTGTIIATDTLDFLPQISLYSDIVDQKYVDDPSWGDNSGISRYSNKRSTTFCRMSTYTLYMFFEIKTT